MRTGVIACLAATLTCAAASDCLADVVIRCVDYNITASGGTPRTGLDTLLQGMGAETVAGRTLPVDLIGMQEVQSQSTTSQAVVTMLNTLYATTAYSRGSLNGGSTGSGTQGVVFNTQKLQLIGEATIGTASTSGQPRQTMRYRFRAVGAPASSDFYVYVGHWKASDDSTSEGRRLVEAQAIRADADALGPNVAIIYMGDFNLYRSTDQSFQEIISSGNGQAVDPVNRIGAWHGGSTFLNILTQAPAVAPPGGLTGGGLDDRFDWQMVTNTVMTNSGVGLTYLSGSYHTFGNNGSVPLNGNINSASSTALPGLPNRTTVLDLLTTVADHLPVVADYVVQIQGACCNGSTCTFVSDTVCSGTWTAGTCSPNPCGPASAACCAATGCCTITTQAGCAGTWISGTSSCAPSPCSSPTGSCCAADGSCSVTNQCACAQTWTSGAACSPNPCPQPTAACCAPTGCCTVTTQAACGGSWVSGVTACAPSPCSSPTGSCCAPDGGCTTTIQCACSQTWTSGASCSPNPCPAPAGACCRGTACTIETGAQCAGTGGVFQGGGTVCGSGSNLTACCPGNFNGVGGITVQDIFDFLAAYFSSNPSADFNHSGAVTVQDIFDFLASYFAGCS